MSVESDLAEHLRLFIAETNEKLAKSLSETSRVHPATPGGDDAVNDQHAANTCDELNKRGYWAAIASGPTPPIPDSLTAVNERLERLERQFKAVDERINTLWSAVANELAKKL